MKISSITNSRESFNNIGKAVRLSPESVRYRINNYIKQDIIKYFLATINAIKLGYSYYDIYIKLQNVDEKKKQEMISYFMNNSYVAWMANVEGAYDIAMIIIVKNQLELQDWVEQFNQKFSAMVMKKTIAINLRGEFLQRDYLINNPRNEKKATSEYSTTEDLEKLDDIDMNICRALSINSRINCVELGKKLNISSDTILLRIKNLRKKDVITGFSIVLNNDKFPQMHYKILLYLNNNSEEKIKMLLSLLRMNPRVIAIIKTLAEWDYEIDAEVENIAQFKEIIMSITNTYSDVVRDYIILRIVDMPKYNFFP